MTRIVIGEHGMSGDPPRAPALPEVAQEVEAPASTSVRLGGGSFFVPLVAVLVSLVAGALLIRLQGVDPWVAGRAVLEGALGSSSGITRTLEKTTPLILAGLAVLLPLRLGLFNIGAQGQLVVGALAAAWCGHSWAALGPMVLPAALVAGVIAGAAWASIAAVLKTARGVHEVISTIMLNSIAAGLVGYLVTYPLRAPGDIPRTQPVSPDAVLPRVAGGLVPTGFLLGIALTGLCSWVLRRTMIGFRLDVAGASRDVANYAGIRLSRLVVGSMFVAGGLAGFAGAIETLGVTRRFEPAFGGSLGFDGITIALIARLRPWATVPAALLVGALRAGAPALQFETGIQPEVVDLFLAITLVVVSVPLVSRFIQRRRRTRATGAEVSG